MIILVAISVFLATVVVALAFFWWLQTRKESLSRRVENVTGRTGEAPNSIFDRIKEYVVGAHERISEKTPFREEEIVAIVTGKELAGGRLLLNQAGYRARNAYTLYLLVRIVLPVALAGLGVIFLKTTTMPTRNVLLLLMTLVILGLLLPDFFLRRKATQRREDITDALPDGLDLLVVCVEAGLGLNAAFVKITEEFQISSPVLSEEFDIVNREMVAGKPRVDALRSLSDRTGVEEVKSLVAMLIQTERLGTSLAQSLRVHSDSLRTRRRQRAEESAAKTTTKLVLPLAFLLFPAMFVVMLGPGVIQVMRILLPTMRGGG